jgi:hypothetical protein
MAVTVPGSDVLISGHDTLHIRLPRAFATTRPVMGERMQPSLAGCRNSIFELRQRKIDLGAPHTHPKQIFYPGRLRILFCHSLLDRRIIPQPARLVPCPRNSPHVRRRNRHWKSFRPLGHNARQDDTLRSTPLFSGEVMIR